MRKPTETRLRKRLKKLSQPHSGWLDVFPAIMGKADGTVRTGIPGLSWIHDLRNGQDWMIFNNAVPNTPLLQVEVGRRVDQPGLWQVKGTVEPFSTPSTGGTSSAAAEHHNSHQFPNSDTVWIDRKQIKPLTVLVHNAAGFVVKLLGGIMLTANGITKISTQTVNLSSYVPTEGAVFVSIESDDDGVITVNEGTGFEVPGIATVDDIPSPAAGKYTRAYVLLYQGQSTLSNNDIVVPMPPDFNPVAVSVSTHDHDTRYPRKWTGKTAAPTADDDSGDGYAVDDIWVDETNDAAYIAVDVTPTAAVWVEMGGSTFDLAAAIHAAAEGTLAGLDELPFWQNATEELRKTTYANLITVLQAYFNDIYAETTHFHSYVSVAVSSTDPTVDDDVSVGYEIPTIWINTTTDNAFVLTDSTDGAAVWRPVIIDHGAMTGLTDDDHTQYQLKSLLTTLGDIIYATAASTWARLAGNITTTRKFLRQVGDGADSAAPAWDTLVSGDIPTLDYATKLSTRPTTEYNANDIFRVNSSSASTFSGTINGTPSGTSVVYNAGFSGNENALVPAATTQLAKLRLYNTTRGNSALISDCNTGTNTITLTATVPANWANGDTITIASQTVSGGTGNWVDLEITSGPTSKSYLFLNCQWTDTGTVTSSTIARLHPTETFGTGKIFALIAQVSAFAFSAMVLLKITSNVFTVSWIPSGSATGALVIREMGYLE